MPIETVSNDDLDAAIIASIPKWPYTVPLKSLVDDFGLESQTRVTEAFKNLGLVFERMNTGKHGRVIGIHPDSYAKARAIGEKYMNSVF